MEKYKQLQENGLKRLKEMVTPFLNEEGIKSLMDEIEHVLFGYIIMDIEWEGFLENVTIAIAHDVGELKLVLTQMKNFCKSYEE